MSRLGEVIERIREQNATDPVMGVLKSALARSSTDLERADQKVARLRGELEIADQQYSTANAKYQALKHEIEVKEKRHLIAVQNGSA